MSITKYAAFVKVAELGSLTKAAEALGYSQPAISHIINSLETRFGFPLFYRSRDACTLTENGQKLLPYCTQIIRSEDQIEQTVNALNGLLTGSIRIGSVSSMLARFVPEAIFHFSTAYSNVSISLNEMTYKDIISSLKAGSIDLGFTSSKLPDKIKFIPLYQDPVCLIIPPDHPFSAYERVPVRLLNGCDFIMPSAGYDDVYEAIADKVEIAPNIRYRVGSDAAVIGMVANHLGISILSSQQAQFLGGAVLRKEFCENFQRSLGIAVNTLYRSSPAVKAFIRAVCSGCGKESQA